MLSCRLAEQGSWQPGPAESRTLDQPGARVASRVVVTPRSIAISLLVLGARGRLGGRVGTLLSERGVEPTPVSHSADPSQVSARDVVCNLASTAPEVVVPWARAGSDAGGYLDAAPTASAHAALADVALGAAPVAPGLGWFSVLGDALAAVAAEGLVAPTRADVTAWVPSRRSLLAGASPRERAHLWQAVAEPVRALVDGEVVTERIAEDRRLAWFPRPVGPHHAVAVPGTHWRTLPRVVPSLASVRTALALRSSSAEVLQAIGNLARYRPRDDGWPPVVPRRAADRGTARERWAVVAEVATAGGDLARGWAYGWDRHEMTAQVVSAAATTVLGRPDPRLRPGLVGGVELLGTAPLLDDLAARTDLRWSVTR